MLTERYLADGGATLATMLLPQEQFHPYPTAQERDAWHGLPVQERQSLIVAGEKVLDFEWPPLPATLFLEFRRDGNRSRYEAVHFARRRALGSLVLAECCEGRGRFFDQIVNGIWAICEE